MNPLDYTRVTSRMVLVLLMSLACSVALAQPAFQTIALTGQQSPGTPAGVNYGFLSSSPYINSTGQVAFFAELVGVGVTSANSEAMYAGGFSNPQIVARGGSSAPGTPTGVNYGPGLFPTAFNDSGQVAYSASLTGAGVTSSNDHAIYAGSIAAPQLVARTGNAAPGIAAGGNYSLLFAPNLNNMGQTSYLASLTGAGVSTLNDQAIYAGSFAAPQLVARKGNAAPGTAVGVNYSSLHFPVMNDTGNLVFGAILTGTGVSGLNDRAIYADGFASPQLVARKGDAAPGTEAGIVYAGYGVPRLNNDGQVAYLAGLTFSGMSSTNEFAIYGGSIAAPQLIARQGSQAPGLPSGVNYSNVFAPSLNNAGQVAYLASLTGTGVTSENNQAIFAGAITAPQPVIRSGDEAPGTGSSVNYAFFSNTPALNDAGQMAYLASLTGTEVTDGNDFGLFAYDPVFGDFLIAREGQVFDVGSGDFRTIIDGGIEFRFGSGNSGFSGLSNSGALAFHLSFTDGSSGIFVTSVPEPTGALLLSIGALGLLRRHRSRLGQS